MAPVFKLDNELLRSLPPIVAHGLKLYCGLRYNHTRPNHTTSITQSHQYHSITPVLPTHTSKHGEPIHRNTQGVNSCE